jgi:hypothetical protein
MRLHGFKKSNISLIFLFSFRFIFEKKKNRIESFNRLKNRQSSILKIVQSNRNRNRINFARFTSMQVTLKFFISR